LTTGISARIKSIPDCILQSPKLVVSAFIRALLDCDGYGGKGGVILSTSSVKMASQFQLLLLNYGIISSINKQQKGMWHVKFSGSYLNVFLKEIGFGLKRKQKAVLKFVNDHKWFNKNKDYDKIISIEEDFNTVYDITVEETHRYIAQGFINHNSFIDYQIMARNGLVGLGQKSHDDGIIEYAKHKMSVLGGKYSMNPYKLGFYLLLDIEERWNKGKFGKEYDECQDANEKEKWDKNLGLGKEKVFEIWKYYDDVNFINEFFTPEFCKKNEFFEWEKHPNGEYVISSKDSVKIKRKLMQKHLNRGLPEIKLIDPNHKNKGYYLLEHTWDGRVIYQPYVGEVLSAIFILTGKPVVLTTKNKNNEDIVYVAPTKKADDLQVYRKEEYFKKWNMF
jgi:stage V sporulation protein R